MLPEVGGRMGGSELRRRRGLPHHVVLCARGPQALSAVDRCRAQGATYRRAPGIANPMPGIASYGRHPQPDRTRCDRNHASGNDRWRARLWQATPKRWAVRCRSRVWAMLACIFRLPAERSWLTRGRTPRTLIRGMSSPTTAAWTGTAMARSTSCTCLTCTRSLRSPLLSEHVSREATVLLPEFPAHDLGDSWNGWGLPGSW